MAHIKCIALCDWHIKFLFRNCAGRDQFIFVSVEFFIEKTSFVSLVNRHPWRHLESQCHPSLCLNSPQWQHFPPNIFWNWRLSLTLKRYFRFEMNGHDDLCFWPLFYFKNGHSTEIVTIVTDLLKNWAYHSCEWTVSDSISILVIPCKSLFHISFLLTQ